MIGLVPRVLMEVAKKIPWWQVILRTAASTAAITVVTVGAQKAIDKIFKDKSKSLEEKLAEIQSLLDSGQITAEEYNKIRDILMEQYAKT
jgi:hypothetical protein